MFVKLAVFACAVSASLAQYQPQQAYNGPLAGGQPASLYPAGVDPQSCPNFPHCSSPLVAVGRDANQLAANYPQIQQAQPQYQGQPQYQQQYQPQPQQYQAQYQPQQAYQPQPQNQYATAQQSQYSPDVQQRLDRGEYIGDGDYHGEGLSEALAPETQQPAAPQYQAYQQQPAVQQYAQPATYQQQAAPQYAQPAQLPAGVSAQSCPNYPLCH